LIHEGILSRGDVIFYCFYTDRAAASQRGIMAKETDANRLILAGRYH
jgi:hypothetical protein